MKKTAIPAIIIVILGLVVAVGSQTFLGPCAHEDGSFGACHWAGRALLGLGGLLAALALISVCVPKGRFGLYLAATATAILGILTPGTLISLCGMATMRCRALMKPAMTILLAITLIAAVVGAILSFREAK